MGKQFLVVRLKGEHGSQINLVPVAGLMPIETAEAFVQQVREAEPDATFLIQEVGNA